MGLRTKIIILLLLSIIPVALVIWSETLQDRRILEEQVGASSLEYARLSLQRINEYLYSKFEDVHSWAHTISHEDIEEDRQRNRISTFLSHMTEMSGPYYHAVLLDTKGKIIAASGPGLLGQNLSAEPGFDRALKGHHDVQDVGLNTTAGDYAVVISIPVTQADDESRVVGVLSAAVKWEKISQMIGTLRIAGRMQNIRDHLMLINSKGLIISCFDPNEMFKTNLIDKGLKSAKYALQKQDGFLREDVTEHGIPSFIAYTYQRKHNEIPDLGWVLLFLQDPQRVFASAETFDKTNLYSLLVYIAVLTIVWFICIGTVEIASLGITIRKP